MSTPDDIDDEEPGFLRRFGIWIGLAVVLAGVAAFFLFGKGEKKRPSRPQTSVTMVTLPPPPPPPPPPEPEKQEEPEEKPDEMVVQEEVKEPEPEPQPEEPPDEPLGTSIQGDGADGFGLSGNGNGMRIGGSGKGKGGGNGTRWGNFAARVQTAVVQALRTDKRTRSAQIAMEVRVWADSTGRITRVAGEGAAAEVLKGLQLPEPPPEDMPMPIVMRITAKRPN